MISYKGVHSLHRSLHPEHICHYTATTTFMVKTCDLLLARTFFKIDPSSVLEIVKSRHVQSKHQEVVILRDFSLKSIVIRMCRWFIWNLNPLSSSIVARFAFLFRLGQSLSFSLSHFWGDCELGCRNFRIQS